MPQPNSAFRVIPLAAIIAWFLLMPIPRVSAETIIDSWKSVKVPPPPDLQPVSVDGATTALLLLDFSFDTCTEAKRPSCVRSIPLVARLLANARAHGVLIAYSVGASASPKTVQPLAPKDGEPTVKAGADKFFSTDLDKILANRGIKSVIVTGTSAHGAVLYTASAAALRGMQVIVPVDGYSADNPFAELYTAWHLKNAPASVSAHVTLTSTQLIVIR
jgi:nicotinamidase-related amidase